MVDFVKLKNEDSDKRRDRKPKSFFSFKRFIIVVILFFVISSIISSITYSLTPKIAVIPVKGPILTQEETTIYGSSISSRDIAETLRTLKSDDAIKAVIIDINSPGGSPVASEEISNAIVDLKEEKPVYALVNDVGASGAFWIAVSADKIYASKMSTLGSIGVTSTGLGFEDFIKEYNITYRKQTAGEFKDMGTPFREPTEEEKEMLQGLLDEIHENFINHVADSRNMSYDEVKEYATGEIFLGTKAKEIGFIDEIGYYPDVIDKLENVTGYEGITIATYGPMPNLIDIIGLGTYFDFIPNAKGQIMLE